MTLKLNGTNSEAAPAYAGDDADTGLQCGTNELKLVTGGSARATVDSSGHLLVGGSTSIRSGDIEIAKESANSEIQVTESSDSGNGPKLRITRTRGSNLSSPSAVDSGNFIGQVSFDSYDSAAYRTGAKIQASAAANWSSGSCATDLIFYTTASGASSPTERMRILSDGTIRLASGCPGIDFSQIQTNISGMNSETLDSYEEGTWDPVVAFGDSSAGVTYQEQKGLYVKIGNFVWASMVMGLTNNGTGSGDISITLPFAIGSNSESRGIGTLAYFAGFSSLRSNPNVYSSAAGNTKCRLQHINSATGAGTQVSTLTNTNVGNGATWRGMITYTTF